METKDSSDVIMVALVIAFGLFCLRMILMRLAVEALADMTLGFWDTLVLTLLYSGLRPNSIATQLAKKTS